MFLRAFNDTFASAWPSLVIFLVTVLILRFMSNRRNKNKIKFHEEVYTILFISYVFLLFNLVTSKDINFGGINYIPFREILRYPFGSPQFYKQVIGNILIFMPFGFFAGYYTKITKVRDITFASLIVSGTIEIVQRFIGRSFDIDDIILNVTGSIIGFLIFIGLDAIRKKLPKFLQNDLFYNIIAILVIIAIGIYFMGVIGL